MNTRRDRYHRDLLAEVYSYPGSHAAALDFLDLDRLWSDRFLLWLCSRVFVLGLPVRPLLRLPVRQTRLLRSFVLISPQVGLRVSCHADSLSSPFFLLVCLSVM
jgi:hypothetical protein